EFQPDTTAPVTTASLTGISTKNPWWRSNVTVALSFTETGHGVRNTSYRVDGGLYSVYTGAFTVTGDGSHLLEYFSTDVVGNVEPVQSKTIQIDTVPPTVTRTTSCSQPGEAGWCHGSVRVTLSSVDATSGPAEIEVSLDNSNFAPYTGPVVIDTDGNFLIEIVAIDAAGNRASSVTQIKIDRTPPSFSLVLPNAPGAPITSSSLSIQVTQATDATSGLAGCSIALDGGASVALGSGSQYRLTGLEDGPHTVVASCSDNAGNVGSKSADFTVNTDLLSPQ